jgi:hypothetical protein
MRSSLVVTAVFFLLISFAPCLAGAGTTVSKRLAAPTLTAESGDLSPSHGNVISNTSYNVTIHETGIQNLTTWLANCNTGTGPLYSTGANITFALTNGSYSCGVSANDFNAYLTYTPEFPVNVTGASETINVSFEASYLAWFNATGLPDTGQCGLDIEIIGGPLWVGTGFGGSTHNVSYQMLNGTYTFNASSCAQYVAVPPNGTYTVNGAAAYNQVQFDPNLNGSIWFSEIGLPSDSNWSVNLTSSNDSQTELGPSTTDDYQIVQALGATLLEGSYSFTVGAPSGYTVDPSSGNFTLSGGQTADVCLVFFVSGDESGPSCSSGQYNADFQSTGLPYGDTLCVNVTGVYDGYPIDDGGCGWDATGGARISVGGLYDGIYNYSLPARVGYVADPTSGTFNINGTAAWINITFTPSPAIPMVYQATFNESGLVSPFTWSVTTNGSTTSSNSSLLVISGIANGSYTFSIPALTGYTANVTSGSYSVNGANVTIWIQFQSVPDGHYPVTFAESGLPAGTNWTARLTGTQITSNGTTIDYSESNGTYLYNITPVSGYSTNYTGQVVVNGGPVTVSIPFSNTTYPVTFRESGLPADTPWRVNATNQATDKLSTASSVGYTVTIDLANGTYSLASPGPVGFYPDLSVLRITIEGPATTVVAVSFEPVPCAGCGPSQLYMSPIGTYLLVGVIITGVVGATAIAFVIRRRRPPAVPPDIL